MKGTLYVQRDKGIQIEKPEPIECEIDMGVNGTILASAGSSVKADMCRAHVDLIGAVGMLISGVEEHAHNLLHHQEWGFVPIVHEEKGEK